MARLFNLINYVFIPMDPQPQTTHVMGEAPGIIVTQHTDASETAVIKRWDIRKMLPGISEPDTPGYRIRATLSDVSPVTSVYREQGDAVSGELEYDYFGFHINNAVNHLFNQAYISFTDSEDSYTSDYPHYYFWPDGVPQSPLIPNQDDYVWEDTLTYAEKQDFAIEALTQAWRPQKRAWLRELAEYVDLNPDIPKHGGYWLRAADRALQIDFQDENVDPLTVAEEAMLAARGATDINSVEDFANNLNRITALFPNGPTDPTLWVGRDAQGNVRPVNLAESVQIADKSIGANYNPIDTDWIVENQPGTVTIDNLTPNVGERVTATVSDPDGIIDGEPITWTWQLSVRGTDWQDLQTGSGTRLTTTFVVSQTTHYRAVVDYTDRYGPGQQAISEAIVVG